MLGQGSATATFWPTIWRRSVLAEHGLTMTMWRRVRDVTADDLIGLSLQHPLAGAEGQTANGTTSAISAPPIS